MPARRRLMLPRWRYAAANAVATPNAITERGYPYAHAAIGVITAATIEASEA